MKRDITTRRILLFLATVIPCMASARDGQTLRRMSRRLEDSEVVESDIPIADISRQEPLQNIPIVDRDGDGFIYNPCSLCQGLTLLEDKIASPDFLGNATCGEANYLLENQPELFQMSYDSCRGEFAFNVLFESCCRSSVPVYQCEQNVHKYIDGLDYDTAVPPIVSFDPEDALNVTVGIQYQALEKLEVEEGRLWIVDRNGNVVSKNQMYHSQRISSSGRNRYCVSYNHHDMEGSATRLGC